MHDRTSQENHVGMEFMKLMPVGKDYLWGGTRLREEYDKHIDMTPLAETWECSIHPDGQSVIQGGMFKGQTLARVLEEHPEYLGSKVGDTKELPVLIKFIDAEKDLSVQVHPDDDYARTYEGDNGKSEMWYVVDAKEDASLIYGFEHRVTKEKLKRSIIDGSLDKYLHKVKIKKGETYYVPAGTVHGIGAGALIAEIQESSNVTYRVYDYDRVDKHGQKRELHFEKAAEVMKMTPSPDVRSKPKLIHYYPGCARELLCRSKYFEVEHIDCTMAFGFSVKEESFQVLLCLDGEGQIGKSEEGYRPVRFRKGDCIFIPAGMGRCAVIGKTELLKIRC